MNDAHVAVTGEAPAEAPKNSGFIIENQASKQPQAPTLAVPSSKQENSKQPDASKKETVPPVASESILAGRVLLVNPKFNFVVVNMGMKQGLKMGDTFMVMADKEKVAKVEVEKLYDDFAAAKIVEQFGNKNLLKEGNLVTRI